MNLSPEKKENACKDRTYRLLFDLSMSVGTSLELKEMFDHSLGHYREKLDCSFASAFMLVKDGVKWFQIPEIAFSGKPDNPGILKKLREILPDEWDSRSIDNTIEQCPVIFKDPDRGHFSYLFSLKDFGFLFLERWGGPLEDYLLEKL